MTVSIGDRVSISHPVQGVKFRHGWVEGIQGDQVLVNLDGLGRAWFYWIEVRRV